MRKMFNVFSRSRKNEEEEKESVLIPTYSGNSTITTPSYKGREIMHELEEAFDEECLEFIKKAGSMDPDNGAYMDQRVDSKVNDALKELDKEHAEHKRLILLPLEEMYEGDEVLSAEALEICEKELEKLKDKLEKLNTIYNKGTAFENVNGGYES